MTTIASTLRNEPSGCTADAARLRLDSGFDALVLSAPLFRSDWDELRRVLPRESILAVGLFLPLGRGTGPERLPEGRTSPFSLGSLRREDKRDAEKHGETTISFASHLAARYVLLPAIDQSGRGFDRGSGVAAATGPPGSSRSPEAKARLDSYLSTLDRLLSAAERHEVTLVITPGGTSRRMPDTDDTALCLAEFRGAPLGVWPDTAEHGTPSAGADVTPPWQRFQPVPGVTLRDVDHEGRLRLPGDGILEWPGLVDELREVPRWLVDPPTGAAPDELSRALGFLRGQLEPEAPDPLLPG